MQLHIVRNGQKSGPYSLDEVRSQLANGTLRPTDLAWHEGIADWQPLSSIPDLAGGFVPPQPAQTSGLAITSMVLGILSFLSCGLTSLPAVICGHISLSRIKKSAGRLAGNGMAIAGLVLGYMGIVIFALFLLAIPAALTVKEKATQMQSLGNAKQIYLGCKLYASDHDGNFPENLDQLFPQYLKDKRILMCPMSADQTSVGYEYFGGTEQDEPDKILLKSKAASKQHTRVILRVDGAAKLERD